MVATSIENNLLTYRGSNFLKQRLVLSTLSGKAVRITDIRSSDTDPGLRGYEISLIRLLDKITNGTKIEINQSGTSLYYRPGLLDGGVIQHNCSVERGIGYYLDALIALGPFSKVPLNATLKGVTSSKESPSVDYIKSSALQTLKKFLVVDDGLELKIKQRGLMPLGGGEVIFKCPVRKNIRAIQFDNPGMVKRIRGTVYASKVSPAFANRTIEAAKGVLLNFIPDIYLYSDQTKGKQAGNSPGFGVNLVAETTNGVFYSTDVTSNVVTKGENPSIPEDVGTSAAHKLLEEIYRGGCVDSSFQWLVALFMALSSKDVSKFLVGPYTAYTISFLQHLREFFSITFKLDNPKREHDDEDNDDDYLPGAKKVLMTCIGIGYVNMNKRTN
ncbi:putative RNA 3'-terminal phosphate cyclase-like protein [Pseudolycoriella hygida]|uniref:RNA 3'-terminal phosphate cyclase-like protein n=1 Tax=Pseudolycoriella hygida TaxID=35572 RepID=A0A9Q0RZP8_9DIPT|nr:putative RNA 3'-terminal phosphate cyclase-like protein [Pseudolycoriella hygida]